MFGSRPKRGSAVAAVAALVLVAAVATVAPSAGATGQSVASPAVPSAGCGTSVIGAGDATITTSSGGVDRTYIRHVSAAHDGVVPVPLVIALHGLGEGSVLHQQTSEWASRADAHGFVVAFPQALGSPAAWNVAAGSPDTAFVAHVLDELESTLCVDTSRVYVSGFSLGAFLTSTLMCSGFADRIAAVAPVAGLRNPGGCAPTRPVPAITFHGTADNWVSFPPTPAYIAAWAGRNGCGTTPAETSVPGDDVVTITHLVFPCPAGGDVEWYRIDGGGHAWPGSAFSRAIAAAVGYTTFAITATDLIWDFFVAHPLPPATSSASIQGTVTAGAGTSVAGTRVWAYAPSDVWLPTAGDVVAADGSYAITALPAGTYEVLFLPPVGSGLLPEWFDAARRPASTPVTLASAEVADDVDASLEADAVITGTVTATGGVPLAGVRAWAYAPGDVWVPSGMALTDATGHYVIDGLPAGTYAVRFAPVGLPYAAEWFDDSASRFGATVLATAVGAPPAPADAVLAAA